MATKTPLRGSCHCGATRYILFLTLPHAHSAALPPPRGSQRFYRCNCTICHKSGQMHVRPRDPDNDFVLLSPLDPFGSLGDYQCFDKVLHFFFCKTCGVRCFIFAGRGELVDMRTEDLGLDANDYGGDEVMTVWRPDVEGGHPELGTYLSVNAHTIDAGQEGFDMRELTESKHVMYCDCLSPEEHEAPMTYERPQKGGCY